MVRSGAERAYELMRTNQAVRPIRVMARVLGVLASGFYDWRDRQPSDRQRSNAALLRRIRTIRPGRSGTVVAPPASGTAGDALDNAMCESFFATLECELIDCHRFDTKAEAQIAVFRLIQGFYNPSRRHFDHRLPVTRRVRNCP